MLKITETSVEGAKIIWLSVQAARSLLWVDNPKLHDIGAIIQSLQRYGLQELPKFDVNLISVSGSAGAIVAGNGRVEALALMEREAMAVPRGIAISKHDGSWVVPVIAGVDSESAIKAASYAIDSNNLTLSGSELTAKDIARLWDQQKYDRLLVRGMQDGDLPVSVDRDDVELLSKIMAGVPGPTVTSGSDSDAGSGEFHEQGKREFTIRISFPNVDMFKTALNIFTGNEYAKLSPGERYAELGLPGEDYLDLWSELFSDAT